MVFLYRFVTLFNLKLKNINIERGKQTFAFTMVLQLQVSKFCESKNIGSAACDTLAVTAMAKYVKSALIITHS